LRVRPVANHRGKTPALFANIRLHRIGLQGTIALAYLRAVAVIKKKFFITLSTGVHVKVIFFVSYIYIYKPRAYKLECLYLANILNLV
jgi:hypothetical protein